MGFTPSQVDAMGVWEFLACLEGYSAANGGGKKEAGDGMSEERMRDLGLLE